MVAVNMRYEYSHYLVEAYSRASHLGLRAFATINHKLLATQLYNLRRRVVAQRWQSRATAKYVDFEWFHIINVTTDYFFIFSISVS